DVTVLGAGIVGWSVAVQLLDALPNCRLTVVADQLDGETVSWVAAGSFRVENFEELCPDRPGQGRKWAADSFQHYLDLAVAAQRAACCCRLCKCTKTSNQTPPDYLQLAHSVATLTPDQLRAEFPRWPSLQCGWSCETTLTESRLYLPFLRARCRCTNLAVTRQRVNSLSEILDGSSCRLLFNCSGLGAAQLAKDPNVYPIRGQVFKVRAPWLKRAVIGPNGETYIYPGATDIVTVGGCRQPNSWSTEPCPDDASKIWSRATRLVPSVGGAETVNQLAGLRPARLGGIRVELDSTDSRIVHCYGHGGNGVALAWGTASEAVKLGLESLRRGG
uniref:DAO domain-containing protein n=1 Tax=Macrostomum lignano TaxID=282301 RepID=A0A1I8HUU8_9PLAT